ncbi:MAG: MFS transporter [Rhodocyclaceae bacterium]
MRIPRSAHSPALVVLAIIGLAINLRPALAGIGPLLDTIEAATGLNHTQASLLTTLPVFVMGMCALLVRPSRQRFGERPGIAAGAVLIAVACALRYVATGRSGLIATAIVAGVGIALVQTLLPAFIKRNFGSQAGRVMGLYTTGIMGGAALAAAASAGLADALGWPAALALWALPAALCLPLWHAVSAPASHVGAPAPSAAMARKLWQRPRAWALMLFFGISTGAYTLVLAWLPPFYTSLGWTPGQAGLLLGGLTLAEVVAGLMVSALIGRFADRRAPLLGMLGLLLVGLLCLIFAPLSQALLACALLGLGIGALFPLSLIVTLDHVDHPAHAADLAAFVQGGGYIIASGMPLIAGLLRDRFADLSHAWMVMALGTLVLFALALRFSPASCAQFDAGAACHVRPA